jgi:hypothetical protein
MTTTSGVAVQDITADSDRAHVVLDAGVVMAASAAS